MPGGATMSDGKVLMVSCDGHVAAPMADYREYLDPQYRGDFDEFLAGYEAMRAGNRISPPPEFFDKRQIDPYVAYMIESGAIDGEFDVERRLKEVATQGVAAEVLFPNGGPFQAAFTRVNAELARAGSVAYNRWLADFCAAAPERFVGQAVITFTDVDLAVDDVHWAKEHGLRGVILPGIMRGARLHWDPALDPFWSALEETGMVANVHGGSGLEFEMPPEGLDLRVAMRIQGGEFPYFAHRPFFFMLWSGVFARHPELRVVWTEQYSDWIPRALAQTDWQWEKDRKYDGLMLQFCPERPSEYWARNCWAGMSLASKAEVGLRDTIGTDKMMFGVDFPHVESSFPKTLGVLQALTEDLSETETRDFLGLNAARLWDLDVDALAPVVHDVGFDIAQVRCPPGPESTDDVDRPLT